MVEVMGSTDPNNGAKGLEWSMDAFVLDHVNTDRQMANLEAGRKKDFVPPPYNPAHPDNKWPVMIYHPSKAPEIIGVTLKGLADTRDEKKRSNQERDNEEMLELALGRDMIGTKHVWKMTPYAKPDIRVASPEEEKAAFTAQLSERDNMIRMLADTVKELKEKFDAISAPEKGKK